MFTGIIETLGKVHEITRRGQDARLTVLAAWPGGEAPGVVMGDSVAVNGTCLTVIAIEPRGGGTLLSFEASHETMSLTSLGGLGPGHPCNLERALRVGDRLGGHWVTGHVDATGVLVSVERRGAAWDLRYSLPSALEPEIVPKGSIAIDGVSLTINKVRPGQFSVTIIPHTEKNTQLLEGGAGKRVNLETDLLAKYIRRMLAPGSGFELASPIHVGLLRRSGFGS